MTNWRSAALSLRAPGDVAAFYGKPELCCEARQTGSCDGISLPDTQGKPPDLH